MAAVMDETLELRIRINTLTAECCEISAQLDRVQPETAENMRLLQRQLDAADELAVAVARLLLLEEEFPGLPN
jgi:hypothetical protein